ncbi:G5 domain-containing protein, partial [Streptococcus suis]
VTVKNTYVDGKLVKSEPIASEVVLAPVEEVTTIGKKAVTEILSNIVDLLSLPITEQVLSTMEPVEFETQKEVL